MPARLSTSGTVYVFNNGGINVAAVTPDGTPPLLLSPRVTHTVDNLFFYFTTSYMYRDETYLDSLYDIVSRCFVVSNLVCPEVLGMFPK